VVSGDRVEEARAQMLELFPEGFAEEERRGDTVELAAFTDEEGASALRNSLGAVTTAPVLPGWEDEWKRFHVPAVVGSLWIAAPWEESPAGLTSVIIDPGRAFGTGGHATTRLCLELLQELTRGSVLDIGCGSGVLAIAAAKLGFGPIVAVDSDPAAVDATRRNAVANDVELVVRELDAVFGPLPRTDIVLANIDLPTLISLTSQLNCRFGVTSGYYQQDELALSGFRHADRRTQDGWAADLFARQ
jgi:ribosomal protein L11 methyltransferase